MIPREIFWKAQPGMSSSLPGSLGRVTLASCSSLGLLWTHLALEEPSAVIFIFLLARSTLAGNSNLSAWDVVAKVAGGRYDKSQQKEVIGRRQAHHVTRSSATDLAFKGSSTNLSQHPTIGNSTGYFGVSVLLGNSQALPFESMLNKRVSKTWRTYAASKSFNPWQMPQLFSLGQSTSALDQF